MNKTIISMGAAGLFILLQDGLPLHATDLNIDGNLTVTGTSTIVDFQGGTLNLGTLSGTGGQPGMGLFYTDGTSSSIIDFIANRNAANWRWWTVSGGQNVLSMKLDENNRLLLYSGSAAAITLSPSGTSAFSGNVTFSGSNNVMPNQALTGAGSILTEGLADGRYLTYSSAASSFVLKNSYSTTFGAATASGTMTTAGGKSTASGTGATAFGLNGIASGYGATALGGQISTAPPVGQGPALLGANRNWSSRALGVCSFAAGEGALASGEGAVALGAAKAEGDFSFATGASLAPGFLSSSFGLSYAFGDYSLAFNWAYASGQASFAGGYAYAGGDASVALGNASANNWNSFAVGDGASANGIDSVAIGSSNASGDYSIAMGYLTVAQGMGQTVIGRFNTPLGTNDLDSQTDALFIIGNGTDDTTRSNAVVVNRNGDTSVNGALTVSGTTPNRINNGGIIVTGSAVTSGGVTKIVSTGTNQLVLIPEAGDISMGDFVAGAKPQ